MKKLLILGLALLISLPLVGCESSPIRISGTFGTEKPEVPSTSISLPDVPPVVPPGIPPWTPPGLTFWKEFSVSAKYDYGGYEEGMATMVYGGYLPFFDLPAEIGTPVAGDIYTMLYDGSVPPSEMEPTDEWLNGAVKSVTVQKAKVVRVVYSNYGGGETFEIYHDNGDREIAKVASHPDYIVQNAGGDGKIYPLDKVMYDQFYATYSPVDGYSAEEGYHFLAFYSGCPRYEKREPHLDTLEAAKELNKNSNLPLGLLAAMGDCDLSEYKGIGGFGSYMFEKDGCQYTFSAYPDRDNGGWFLTSVTAETKKLTVFGLDGDESDNSIVNTMTKKGYKLLDWVDSHSTGDLTFLKNGVQITFAGKAKARTISIKLFVSNDLGYVY